ncbi:MASE3 domain-containing protein [Pseudodesulfovibrio sp.]|uniref:MASE3 domain-containing protein n=1 Tax=Pseudodesulfovibrio sp. TaxID=2035812 RepID=UPI00262CA27C|nr:MASE3 domain-containing protein [Pseudodesulfovibrio sp.]MDD3311217.1 MASE3 domain-containing protein [Pseudodesulfovibrio sp.]
MLVGLYFTSLDSYLLFHALAEMFSIVVAFGIFVIGWNSRSYIKNNYLLFLAIAYLFIALLDLLHTLSYKGMGIFSYQYYANQLWIATRYMESLSLLAAFLFVRERRRFNPQAVFAAFSAVTLLVIAAIFWWHVFPVCFVEGQGLTPFKKNSEYVISAILLLDIAILLSVRKEFDPAVHRWLVWSLVFTIASELAFTFYISNYGFSNLVGHYFKVFSFYLIYKALVSTGLTKPHAVLFKALQDSEAKFRALVESSMDIIWEENRQGEYTYVSPHVRAILGYEPEEMVGRPVADFLAPEDAARARRVFAAPGDVCPCLVNQESEFVHRDGRRVVLERHGMTIVDERGEVRGYRGVDRDVTERRRQERELRKLILAVEGNPGAIVITDPLGLVEYGNPAFCAMMGTGPAEFRGRTLPSLLEGVEDGAAFRGFGEAITSGRAWRGELHRSPANGDSRWLRLSVAPVTGGDGALLNHVATLEDVTDRKDFERLKESVDQIMRHDLKSPLSGIIAIPGLLLADGNLTEAQRSLLAALEEASRRMLRMVNNSLDLFKMEQGTFAYEPERVDALRVLRAVLGESASLARASAVEVRLSAAGLPASLDALPVMASEDLLHSIFANLLTNAIEASPAGGAVFVEVGGDGCRVSIRNRGAVPREIRGQFFQKYKTHGKKRGTGLGAYSAKLQADAMGLDLHLDIDDERDETLITITCPPAAA